MFHESINHQKRNAVHFAGMKFLFAYNVRWVIPIPINMLQRQFWLHESAIKAISVIIILMCDTMSSENSSTASSDAAIECTMSVKVETEDVRLTVHVDIRTVSACIFNMHFKMSFAKNRAKHDRRILPNAASHVRTQVRTKQTLL